MFKKEKTQAGFTLIEIAIVLIVVTILIGYTAALVPVQQELRQYQTADAEMKSIVNQLAAFAQINGRLPCPDTDGDVNSTTAGVLNGVEDRDDDGSGFDDSCKAYFGVLPARTLAILGKYNGDGQLMDPWGEPYYYAVSNVDNSGNGQIDLVTENEIRNEGVTNVTPDLVICKDNTATGHHLTCPTASDLIVENVAAVVISLGKDRGKIASNIQEENQDDLDDGTNDKVYIAGARSDAGGAVYDDVVVWLSTQTLFTKMIQAGQLP